MVLTVLIKSIFSDGRDLTLFNGLHSATGNSGIASADGEGAGLDIVFWLTLVEGSIKDAKEIKNIYIRINLTENTPLILSFASKLNKLSNSFCSLSNVESLCGLGGLLD